MHMMHMQKSPGKLVFMTSCQMTGDMQADNLNLMLTFCGNLLGQRCLRESLEQASFPVYGSSL